MKENSENGRSRQTKQTKMLLKNLLNNELNMIYTSNVGIYVR
jgi:hypothetical protein